MITLLKNKIKDSNFLNNFRKVDYNIKTPQELKKEIVKVFKHMVFSTKENNHCIISFHFVLSKFKNEEEDFIRESVYLVNRQIRKSDRIFRIGESDFVILLPNTYFSETESVIRRVKKIILNFAIKNEKEINIYFRMFRFTPFTNEDELLRKLFSKKFQEERS